jgi:hypothetical protein
MWEKFFFSRLRNILFFPFIVYLTFVVVYVTHIYEKKIQYGETKDKGLDFWFLIIVLIFVAYFLALEIR